MLLLFKAILSNARHRVILFLTFATILMVTLSSQFEMIALGVLTDTQITPGQTVDVRSQEEVKELIPTSISKLFDSDSRKEIKDHWLAKIKRMFNLEKLTNLLWMVIFIAIFKAFSMFSHQYLTQLVAIRVSRDLRQTYFEHIQTQSLNFYQRHNVGSLSARVVADANTIAESINSFLINYFQTPFILITTLLGCFLLNWQLSCIIFFGLPLIAYPIVFLAKRIKRIAKQLQKNQEGFSTVLLDFLRGIQTIKIFSMEKYSLKKYKEKNDEMASLEARSARYSASSRPILHLIGSLFLVSILLFGLFFFSMNISEILTFCAFLYLFYEPIKKFAEENAKIQRGIAAAERMYDVLDEKAEIQDKEKASSLVEFKDKIKLENVWFKYDREWVLKGLNLEIKKGSTIAIVGPTGSGKSTLVQLLPRLYDPQKGTIRIDGTPLTDLTQDSIRKSMSFVPQQPFLFLDTLAANICFGEKFSEEEMEVAAKRAHAWEFIEKLPKRFEEPLADSGKNLSGGQQQRLAIARALIKKSSILVMDEATSSLDSISENHIKNAILELHGEMTQIIIAHRLSTIEHADMIVFLDQGKIIAKGTKTELLSSCPQFKIMWETLHQSKGQHANSLA